MTPKTEQFLGSLVGSSAATKKLYRTVLAHFLDYTKKEPELIEDQDLQEFLQHLEGEHFYKKNTLRAYVNILRNFLKFINREDLRTQIKPVKPPLTLPMVPRPEEIENMIASADTVRNRLVVQMLARTGLRVGELCNLDIRDIDLQNLRLIVRTRGSWGPKGSKERVVRMDSKTASMVKEQIQSRKEGLLLATKPSTIRALIRKIAMGAGVRNSEKITPHKLKHFFACDFLQRGGDIRSLQKLLGHAELSTTEIYLDFGFDRVSQAYDKAFGIRNRGEDGS